MKEGKSCDTLPLRQKLKSAMKCYTHTTCGISMQSLKNRITIGLRLTFLVITFMHWNWTNKLNDEWQWLQNRYLRWM